MTVGETMDERPEQHECSRCAHAYACQSADPASDYVRAMALDLMRRARALAERGAR